MQKVDERLYLACSGGYYALPDCVILDANSSGAIPRIMGFVQAIVADNGDNVANLLRVVGFIGFLITPFTMGLLISHCCRTKTWTDSAT